MSYCSSNIFKGNVLMFIRNVLMFIQHLRFLCSSNTKGVTLTSISNEIYSYLYFNKRTDKKRYVLPFVPYVSQGISIIFVIKLDMFVRPLPTYLSFSHFPLQINAVLWKTCQIIILHYLLMHFSHGPCVSGMAYRCNWTVLHVHVRPTWENQLPNFFK